MDLPDLKNIRIMRKRLNWTQSNLAQKSNISQSMITKIESGKKQPSYETAMKLFSILNDALELQLSKTGKAKDISTSNLIGIGPNETINNALEKLGSNFDQLPVMASGKCIGTINLRSIINLLKKPNAKQKLIKDVMATPLPIISEDESISHVQKMLEIFDAILTSKNAKITGIITRSDLIKIL